MIKKTQDKSQIRAMQVRSELYTEVRENYIILQATSMQDGNEWLLVEYIAPEDYVSVEDTPLLSNQESIQTIQLITNPHCECETCKERTPTIENLDNNQ